MKRRHLTTGQVVLLIIGFIAILGICYALTGKKKDDAWCAFAGCIQKVEHEGDYCDKHDTYEKRLKTTHVLDSSYDNTTSSNMTSNSSTSNSSSSSLNSSSSSTSSYKPSSSNSSASSTNSYKPSSSSSKYNSSHSYDSYYSGYDDVYMDGDYDQNRYDRDDDYADGVDDAIEDDIEDGDEGDW
jgi:DNA mismatch repair ATPase MutL